MTRNEAKQKVWEHWEYLKVLAKRRFPGKEEQAEEAQLFVLNKLGEEDWRRVRAWQGKSNFAPYLGVIVKRLLTDFDRATHGYQREPKWLREQRDSLWHRAYRLHVVQNLSRLETIETLASDTSRERWFIEEVVSAIVAKCRPIMKPGQQLKDDKELSNYPSGVNQEPPAQLIDDEKDNILRLLLAYVTDCDETRLPSDIHDKLERLRNALTLSDEDRLMLRLHGLDGIKLQAVKKMLHENGDIYKRYNKVLRNLREACRSVGLVEE